MNMLRHIALPLLMACWTHPAQGQTTWHVDDDCAAPGAGTEADPFCTIQDGVNEGSDGDTILVAPGTYIGPGNRDISLFGKEITLKSTDGPSATDLDLEGNPSSIHRGFFLIHGESSETIIKGFTITNGYLIGDTGGSGPAGGGGGAGIYIRNSSPTIRNCVLRDNLSATLDSPFVRDGRGGAIYVDGNSSALIDACIIANNIAQKRGGAVYIRDDDSSVTVVNSVITGNSSSIIGGGLYNTFAATLVSNTLILGNTATFNGGGVHNEHGELSLKNSIIWGNESGSSGPQISVQGSVVTVAYCNVQGGLPDVGGCCDPVIDWGAGNIDADPLFVDPDGGDYHLLHGSPVIDAGNNLAVPADLTTDFDGDPRFLDDPNVPDTGNPDPDAPELPIVDMGPDEFDHLDCNNNDVPDEQDLADGTSADCNANDIPDECESDCNRNDQQDSCDIDTGSSEDCNDNAIPDECEIDQDSPAPGGPFFCHPATQDCDPDCNDSGQPDSCDIAEGESEDCDRNGVPDECDPDCNENGEVDACEVADGSSEDCNDNAVPDECEEWADCNGNGVFDSCDIAEGTSVDCGVPDGVPDECCPGNPLPDDEVGPFDVAALLASWGPCPDSCIEGVPSCQCRADFDRNCTVNAFDLAFLLGHWGPCP